MKPQRIQRRRTKGWKMPENTVSVTRPGKWGNPFVIGFYGKVWGSKGVGGYLVGKTSLPGDVYIADATIAVELFEKWMEVAQRDYTSIRGKNLACFCPIGQVCHADVLLKLAND